MNPYFEMNDTIYDITEKYPEAIAVLANAGFENMRNKSMRETMGKTITLRQALKMKQVNEVTFEERLVELIEGNQNDTDTTLVQKNRNHKATVSIQGVLPCPIRIPLLEGFEKWLTEQEPKVKEELDYQLQAASMGVDWIKEQVKKSKSPDVLADLFISAGFDLFFDKQLIGKFKSQGVFKDLSGFESYNQDFENERIQLRDPKGQYSMLGVVPAVFLINQDELNGRSMPESWEDLLKPEYENAVSLPIGDFDLFNAILLNIHKQYGEEGIKKLGRSLLQSMHPSEMVKSHTRKVNKPVVTIMPYFFTRMTKNGGPMKAVWPKDGAIISPIFMLSKVQSRQVLLPFIDFFSSKQVGEILSHQGLFPSVHPEVDNQIDPKNQYMWLGWDYINQQDMGELIGKLEALFQKSAEEELR
ncbi:ABC transporter substrate-binding protein [Anaeromicropila populeti]|uniref:ABC-type Fe3+ transport system, substrate-binding protein n=1 Tax=Anaeromicropila populeti TaxID=37658 RepID=A0A1I6KBI5_9FIRM|nr:ABC transporter substrate-binding protein [Anaeromicropila populeti]SFR88230.1 ABC-type Fe3+ transport system, substrate-binding protein [Anaeromicropila populeti]